MTKDTKTADTIIADSNNVIEHEIIDVSGKIYLATALMVLISALIAGIIAYINSTDDKDEDADEEFETYVYVSDSEPEMNVPIADTEDMTTAVLGSSPNTTDVSDATETPAVQETTTSSATEDTTEIYKQYVSNSLAYIKEKNTMIQVLDNMIVSSDNTEGTTENVGEVFTYVSGSDWTVTSNTEGTFSGGYYRGTLGNKKRHISWDIDCRRAHEEKEKISVEDFHTFARLYLGECASIYDTVNYFEAGNVFGYKVEHKYNPDVLEGEVSERTNAKMIIYFAESSYIINVNASSAADGDDVTAEEWKAAIDSVMQIISTFKEIDDSEEQTTSTS